jgi:hypothetical protein
LAASHIILLTHGRCAVSKKYLYVRRQR